MKEEQQKGDIQPSLACVLNEVVNIIKKENGEEEDPKKGGGCQLIPES
jgi:hypothetical protein